MEERELDGATTKTPTRIGHTQIVISDNRESDRAGNILKGDNNDISMAAPHVGVVDQDGNQMPAKAADDLRPLLTTAEKQQLLALLDRLRTEVSGPRILPE